MRRRHSDAQRERRCHDAVHDDRGDRGEVASWLIIAAGLAVAAAFAAVAMQRVAGLLTQEVADAAGVEIEIDLPPLPDFPPGADPSLEPPLPPSTGGGWPNVGPDPEAPRPDSLPVSPPADPDSQSDRPEFDGSNPSPPAVPEPESETPPQLAPHVVSALEEIQRNIDAGDDMNLSEGELNRIFDILESLDPAERELIMQQLTNEQLERLFHGVHADRFLRNNWDDRERAAFYNLLSGLSQDTQQRLSEYTDYFDLYDADVDPTAVAVTEVEYVDNYEAIINLPLDEFLALRAFMWDNPELLAQSPFDWYADGCSVPGGHYPDGLNGPCLRHDFGYTNARLYAHRFDEDFRIDMTDDPRAERWKEYLDRKLGLDAVAAGHRNWGAILYAGVAGDYDEHGLPSGRETFESPYAGHYGPGFDLNLGQWPDDLNTSPQMHELIAFATNGVAP